MFKTNEGKIERVVRVALGLAILGVALTALSGVFQIIAFVISAMMLFTGVIGICPLYTVIGRIVGQKELCPTCTREEQAAIKSS